MGRLTRKIEHLWCVEGVGFAGCVIACRYSECGDCRISDAFTKLAHYEDLEEAGRLIELPCAVGDTVYLIDAEEQTYDEAKVDEILITKNDIELISDYEVGTSANADYVTYDIEELFTKLKELEE